MGLFHSAQKLDMTFSYLNTNAFDYLDINTVQPIFLPKKPHVLPRQISNENNVDGNVVALSE